MSSAYSFTYQFPLPREERAKPVAVPQPLVREEVARLRESLAAVALQVTSGSELLRALEKNQRDERIRTTVPRLDALLHGGLARGKLIELTGRRSSGRFSAVLATLASATSCGEAAALIDLGDHFDPQAAETAGVELPRLLWVRPEKLKDAVSSAEMAISTGFQLVVVDLGMHPVRGRRVPEAAWVRLARAAEAHGSAVLVSSPYAVSRTASDAVVAAANARPLWQGTRLTPRLLAGTTARITLEKHRHIRPGSVETMRFSVAERIR